MNIKPSLQHEDRLLWSLTSIVHFTVNSTYKEILCHYNQIKMEIESKFWLSIWHLNIPHKCQLFLLKVAHDILPVTERMARIAQIQNINCLRYNSDMESAIHMLFQCNYARCLKCITFRNFSRSQLSSRS